ncbi:MAG: glycosyltransferase family 4 protein [Bacteroidetes bacterium]|nr:glycosyltransferase family 4 protein [Bacteroidota bacterium]
MNIWLVSIFENTPIDDNLNTRYNSLVTEANKRGHQVTFWSSTFRHNVKQQRFDGYKEVEINQQTRVKFVPADAYQQNISVARMASHYKLSKSMVALFDAEPKPDVIVVAYPPISTAHEVIIWAKKQNIPVIVDIIDPWPNAFLEHMKGLKKIAVHLGILPLKQKANSVFNNASGIMAISKQYIDFAKTYRKSSVPTAVFYPAVQFDEMKRQLTEAAQKVSKDSQRITVIYAGSLGFSYDLPTILKAAEILEKEQPNIHFIIAGDGPQKEMVQVYEQQHSNLEYLGRLPKEKLMEEYYLADIGLTQHIQGATQSVTYKLFDLLACGLPIMNSLESEMKSIILDHQVGFHNEPGNARQLADNILKCAADPQLLQTMKKDALALTQKLGDAAVVYSKALDFIESQVK